jgi:conserved oligomeric Golgi complex subunit 6
MYVCVCVQVCLDDLAASRRQSLSKRFTTALTRGGPGGVPKPIEMQARTMYMYIYIYPCHVPHVPC